MKPKTKGIFLLILKNSTAQLLPGNLTNTANNNIWHNFKKIIHTNEDSVTGEIEGNPGGKFECGSAQPSLFILFLAAKQALHPVIWLTDSLTDWLTNV